MAVLHVLFFIYEFFLKVGWGWRRGGGCPHSLHLLLPLGWEGLGVGVRSTRLMPPPPLPLDLPWVTPAQGIIPLLENAGTVEKGKSKGPLGLNEILFTNQVGGPVCIPVIPPPSTPPASTRPRRAADCVASARQTACP